MSKFPVSRREKSEMTHALDSDELTRIIKEFMDPPPPIVTEETIDTINQDTIFLYQRDGKGTVGHWTCILKHGDNKVEYFDSYGENYGIDVVKPYISQYRIEKSRFPLQATKPAIQDCGVWVADRLKHRDKSYSQYVNMVRRSGPNHDLYVVRDIY